MSYKRSKFFDGDESGYLADPWYREPVSPPVKQVDPAKPEPFSWTTVASDLSKAYKEIELAKINAKREQQGLTPYPPGTLMPGPPGFSLQSPLGMLVVAGVAYFGYKALAKR